MKTEAQNVTSYTLRFLPRQSGGSFFSLGKLMHVAQTISGNYAESFSIKVEEEYLFENNDLEQVEVFSIELPGISAGTADQIAGDLCAFLNLEKVTVTKTVCEKYTVVESI